MLFSIGHSNHPIEHVLGLLRRHGVAALADVRSRPYSRFVPHFSREALEQRLRAEGIGYLYFGAELGGKPVRAERQRERPTMRPGLRSQAFGPASSGCWRRPESGASRCCAASAIRSTATAFT